MACDTSVTFRKMASRSDSCNRAPKPCTNRSGCQRKLCSRKAFLRSTSPCCSSSPSADGSRAGHGMSAMRIVCPSTPLAANRSHAAAERCRDSAASAEEMRGDPLALLCSCLCRSSCTAASAAALASRFDCSAS
eukprot:scaffold14290_cov125-Isochrysis_galbana.AAC.8